MGYFKDVWSDLVFNAGNAATDMASSLSWRRRANGDNTLKYVSESAYKSVMVHVAKQLILSTLEGELNGLLSKYLKYASKKALKAKRDVQEENQETLIENGKKSTEGFGRLECQGGHTLIAKTKYGTPVPEALILSYDDTEIVQYEDILWSNEEESYTIKKKSTLEALWNPGNEIEHNARGYQKEVFSTKTVFHIDLAPQVTMNSSKNIVMTQVQGRDYTRKELISGGDLSYSISGNIVSDQEGVYPTEAVKRFIKIMQYNGIIDVNFITFGLVGVKRILIKEFSLGHIECKNIQPYTFSCVAVEPDDPIKIAGDTIASVDEKIAESSWDTWYKSILENKLVQMGAQTALSTASSAATSATSSGLDSMTSNI